MKTLIVAAALTLLQAGASVAQYGSYPPPGQRASSDLRGWGSAPEARVWIDGNRDYYRRGDRLRAAFSTSADAYVAVVHIDPDGRLEFLYPSGPADREYVRGGRSYPLPYRASSSGWLVRSGPGIGYLYVIASPVPLDYGYFRGRGGPVWDWALAGQTVRGDPFWALEQITRYLVPDWGYTRVSVDYYSYQVDGLHRYPNYACAPRYGSRSSSWGWGWGGGYNPPYYGACDRLDYYLRDHPYYFDADRYRADRRSQFRGYGVNVPQYRYKEDPESARGAAGTATGRAVAPAPGSAPRGTGSPTPVVPSRRPAPEPSAPSAPPGRRAAPEPTAPAAAPARGVTPPARNAPEVRRVPAGDAERGGAAPSTTEPRRRSTADGG